MGDGSGIATVEPPLRCSLSPLPCTALWAGRGRKGSFHFCAGGVKVFTTELPKAVKTSSQGEGEKAEARAVERGQKGRVTHRRNCGNTILENSTAGHSQEHSQANSFSKGLFFFRQDPRTQFFWVDPMYRLRLQT